jgi:hypothetical protein
MTRKEALNILISQAHANGFDFRRWYLSNIALEWTGTDEAVTLLTMEGRFYSLVFSHEFARAFWQNGAQMSFIVPAASYSRMNGKGQVVTINRKAFTRRTIKADVWKYHLRQMAMNEDPLRYLKRFMPTQGDLNSQFLETESLSAAG